MSFKFPTWRCAPRLYMHRLSIVGSRCPVTYGSCWLRCNSRARETEPAGILNRRGACRWCVEMLALCQLALWQGGSWRCVFLADTDNIVSAASFLIMRQCCPFFLYDLDKDHVYLCVCLKFASRARALMYLAFVLRLNVIRYSRPRKLRYRLEVVEYLS